MKDVKCCPPSEDGCPFLLHIIHSVWYFKVNLSSLKFRNFIALYIINIIYEHFH